MLPPFIIDQIRKREEDERRHRPSNAPRLPIPIPGKLPGHPEEDEPSRGVVIIDVAG